MYLDAKGLIVQSNGDAGDCLQREGFFFEGNHLGGVMPIPGMAAYSTALVDLSTPNGFVRSWMPGTSIPPWNDPTDCSRDQLVSNIRAIGYFKYTKELNSIFVRVIKNFSRYPNGDIAFINDYGRFIRAYKAWYLYPLLFLFDVPLIVNSIIRIIAGLNPNNVGDDINHIGDLAQAQKIFPTPISFLARKIYKWFRPRGVQYALDWYFRVASNANPEFAVLWAPIVTKF